VDWPNFITTTERLNSLYVLQRGKNSLSVGRDQRSGARGEPDKKKAEQEAFFIHSYVTPITLEIA